MGLKFERYLKYKLHSRISQAGLEMASPRKKSLMWASGRGIAEQEDISGRKGILNWVPGAGSGVCGKVHEDLKSLQSLLGPSCMPGGTF